jgi:NADPH2:quinone reductase
MKAVQMVATGGPDVLQPSDVPEPAITAPGQIKVRIRAAGINPIDTKVRSRGLFQGEPPAVLGCDGAGEVVETGPAVRHFAVGDPVWFCHGGLGGAQGNYAEYTVLDETHVEPKPASLSFEEAAAAPLALITAWESLVTQARTSQGDTVLIHAGAGGVGHLAIQLAKLHGARVVTTVSSPEKAEFVRGLGADDTIDYTREDFVARTLELTKGAGADTVYDTVGPDAFSSSIEACAHYGNLVTLLDPGPGIDWKEARIRNLSIHFTLMLTPWLRGLETHWARQNQILRRCAAWFDEGRLQVRVGQVFPLAEAAEAHRLIEAGHATGKQVLAV